MDSEKEMDINEYILLHLTIMITGGHGGGCVGCAHPPKNLKSPDTPPCRRQGGCAPHGVGPGAKKNFFRILFTKILNFF